MKIAARNAIDPTVSEPKAPITAAAHHTMAQPNCIFHLSMMLEVALDAPSIAPIIARNVCDSYRPVVASDISSRKIEMPMPIQTAAMARPIVVSGRRLMMRIASTEQRTDATIIVIGQASALCPHVDQAIAT